MNCEWVKSQIVLYAFDELGDSERAEVEHHLERCEACARAAEAERQLRRVMDLRPGLEPSPALLAQCRAGLSEALEALPAGSSRPAWRRFLEVPAAPFTAPRFQWQAALAVLLLFLGFSGGWIFGLRKARTNGDTAMDFPETNISNIHSINTAPNGMLEIALDTTRRRVLTGSPDDPRMERLLVYALRNYYNSGIRLDSIELLKNRTHDNQIRSALVAALRSDRNPGVRLKALEALKGFESNGEVKEALMQVLQQDNNPGVRIQAIDLLVKQQDTSTIPMLQRLAEGDPNNYIRMKSAGRLRELNIPAETY